MRGYGTAVERLLRQADCYQVRPGKGSHAIWFSPVIRRHFPVPARIKSRIIWRSMAMQEDTIGKRDQNLIQVQHPIIRKAALPETIYQLFILGGAVAVSKWLDLGFELSLLLLLVLGFSLNTLNVMASTMSQNVHLAEIRDLLLEQSTNLSRAALRENPGPSGQARRKD